MSIAAGIYAAGTVNFSINVRDATADSDNDLNADPVRICRKASENFVGWIIKDTWVCFKQFNFGSGPVFIELEAASAAKNPGTIIIRQDAPDGYILGTVEISTTPGQRVFEKFRAPLTPNLQSAGKKDLYLCFDGPDPDRGLFSIRSFTMYDDLSRVPDPESEALASLPKENKRAETPEVQLDEDIVLTAAATGEAGSVNEKTKPGIAAKIIIGVIVAALFFLMPFYLYKKKKGAKKSINTVSGPTHEF